MAFHHALYVDHRPTVLKEPLLRFGEYRDFPATLRSDVDAILARPESRAYVAWRNAQPLGYITGHYEDDPRRVIPRRGVIEDWFVDDAERGSGIGAALLDTLLDEFRRVGCGYVESTTWPDNVGARRAHEAAGFVLAEVKYRRAL
ncbi:MAG: GNAT family N-acetyltransferase [Myxococcota bacterium]